MVYCKSCKFNKPNPDNKIVTYCTLKETTVLRLGLCPKYTRPLTKEVVNV